MTAPGAALRIPLFPLGTVLFPGGQLPLRVFEVRYLDMVKRCQEEGTPFGVVTLTQGREVRDAQDTPESFEPVGTLASIMHVERPHPGLMMVRCLGTQRFRLRGQERLKHGLWVGDAEPLPDDPVIRIPDDLMQASRSLQQLLAGLQARGGDQPPPPIHPPYHWDDCGWVANRWCELLPVSTELKQRCMMLDSPVLRLELVSDMLDRLRIRADRAGGEG